jgi:hypothetical protein
MTKKTENTAVGKKKISKVTKQKQNKVTYKEITESSDQSEQSEEEVVSSSKRKKVSHSTSQPVTSQIVKETPKSQAASTSKKKSEKVDAKVEVVAIRYICPSDKHPNHVLHDHIDRYPIEQIIGYGTHFLKADVNKLS